MQAKRTLAAAAAATTLAALVCAGPASAHSGHGRKIDARVLDAVKSVDGGDDAGGTLREWRPGGPRRGPFGPWVGRRGHFVWRWDGHEWVRVWIAW